MLFVVWVLVCDYYYSIYSSCDYYSYFFGLILKAQHEKHGNEGEEHESVSEVPFPQSIFPLHTQRAKQRCSGQRPEEGAEIVASVGLRWDHHTLVQHSPRD